MLGAEEGTMEAELGGTARLWEIGTCQEGWLGHWQPWAMNWGHAHLEEGAGREQGIGAGRHGPSANIEGLSHSHKTGWLLVAQLCLCRQWPMADENICGTKWRGGDGQ